MFSMKCSSLHEHKTLVQIMNLNGGE